MGLDKKIEEGWNTNGINGELLEISASEEPPVIEEPMTEPAKSTEIEPVKELEPEPKPKRGELSKDAAAILAKLQAEKKRRQELEAELNKVRLSREKEKLVQDFVARGWPEEEAANMAEDRISQKMDNIQQRQESEEIKLKLADIEIKDLTNDSFFADAESFSEEIKEKMAELKCDAETAYMALRGKARMKEFQQEQDQRSLVKKAQTPAHKIENASPVAIKAKYQLDDADKKALAGLQKAQPEAGWNVEKFWKMMKE
jgi:hypothetical protein